ncbi:46399_t:CDS:2, partial [Gigaspora margarita]
IQKLIPIIKLKIKILDSQAKIDKIESGKVCKEKNSYKRTCDPNIKRQDLMEAANKEWQNYRKEPEIEIRKLINQFLAATLAQRHALELTQEAESKIDEYECLLIHTKKKHFNLLQSRAAAQGRFREKRKKQLNDGIVEIYDTRGRPSEFQKNPNLLDQIHKCVEYGAADKKRRKTVIKVRTIKHLKVALQEKYNVYIARQTLSTYLLPRYVNTRNALCHRYPTNIKINAVSRSEMKSHIDEHYCLALVKTVKVFASTFANYSLIILQDDKAKVGLGVPAIGRTFQSIQSFNEPVTVSDYDFPHRAKQKLIPSVYLIINPEDTNESLCQGQLSIYIRPEYFVGTSLMSHMRDLLDISKHDEYAEVLKHDEHIKSVWILLVDGGPDENPKHLKNIIEYCRFFHELNLNYLSVRTHAPYQSAYNLVERSMCTLSEKLAGIELLVDRFGSHLNSQGVVIDEDLARRNFEFAGECLCEIWKRDKIHEKQVCVDYVGYDENPFQNNGKENPSWLWIEHHIQICRYSLDIRKCSNTNCCSEIYAKEAFDLLRENNGFIPPLAKGKDNHYLNPIHILQYMDKMRLSKYDEICPSMSLQTYQRLCKSSQKNMQKNTNQTFIHEFEPFTKSISDMSCIQLISSLRPTVPYFSAEEVNASLDHIDTRQIELSNIAFLEDFSNLPSIVLSRKFETSNLLEALSDVE